MNLRAARMADAAPLAAILSDWMAGTQWMPALHTRNKDPRFVRGLGKTFTDSAGNDEKLPDIRLFWKDKP